MPNSLALRIAQDSDVVVASMHSLCLAKKNGMNAVDSSLCATVVSELATNIIRYAKKGEIFLRFEQETLHITAKDQGPGIADVRQAMQEGFSGGSGLGLGLSGIKRIMDDMRIETQVGKGTSVFVHKAVRPPNLQRLQKYASQQQHLYSIDESIRMRPFPGQSHIGDGAIAMDIAQHRFLALWDVSGHGEEADILSKQITSFLRLNSHQEPHQLLQALHQRFLGTRGLVAVIARLHPASGKLAYAGIGNVSCLHQRQQVLRRLSLQEGVIGYQIRTPNLQHLQLHDGDSLIMHSDGIQSIRQALPINPSHQAADVTNHIMRQHSAAQADDACCLVLRYSSSTPIADTLEATP